MNPVSCSKIHAKKHHLARMLSNAAKAGFLTSFFLAAGVGHAEQLENPGNRMATEILSGELLTGPNYRVGEMVVSYGYMDHWAVDSDFGAFEVTGDGALRSLIREIYAIAALEGSFVLLFMRVQRSSVHLYAFYASHAL